MSGDVGITIENFEQATPIVTGFLAGYVVAMPLLGAYSDARGRIPVYVVCLAAFALGSVVTATSGLYSFAQLPWLVAGRFLQGLGGGGLVPLAPALPPGLSRDRARAGALVVPVGAVAVVVLGAYTWRQVRRLEPLIPRDLLRSPALLGATAANVLIGAALIVTLVDVPIVGRLVFNLEALDSGLLLTQFLIGVPVGAVAGGLIASRIGNRITAIAGMAVSAAAFLQMSSWTANELDLHAGPLRQAD